MYDTMYQNELLAKTIRKYMENKGFSKYYETTLRRKFPALTDDNIISVMLLVGAAHYSRIDSGEPMWGLI